MRAVNQKNAPENFLVRVDQIPDFGLLIEENLSPEWLSQLLDEPSNDFKWKATTQTHIRLMLQPEADMIHFSGGGQFLLSYPCVRCMTEVSFAIPIELNIRLTSLDSKKKGISHDIEMYIEDDGAMESLADDRDLAVAHYEGEVIDLTDLLREQLFLDLPAYPSCDHVQAQKAAPCQFNTQVQAAKAQNVIEGPFAQLAKLRDRFPKS